MSNMDILWVVSVVAALAAVAGIIMLRRKPKRETNTDRITNDKTPSKAKTTEPVDSLFSTFDDQALEANTHLDPIAEADVYLAYGNRQQAVSVLRKAALENPGRADLLEKIREIREAMKTASGQ